MSQTNYEHNDINANLERMGQMDLSKLGHHRDAKEIYIGKYIQNFFQEMAFAGTLDEIPPAGLTGRFFYVTSGEKAGYLFFDDGRAWHVVNAKYLSDLLGNLDSIQDGTAFKKVAAGDITDGHVNKVSDGVNSKTALEIKSHIDAADIHRSINDNGSAATDLWSAMKIKDEIADAINTYKSIYDADGDGKVDHAKEADIVNWSGIVNKPSEYLPTAHNKSHAYGGPDAITPQDINAMPKGPITWNQLKGI